MTIEQAISYVKPLDEASMKAAQKRFSDIAMPLGGLATGNMLLKDFSNILSASALSLCFVGRNGGNKFLAIFENCTDDQLNTFLARIAERVKQHNQSPSAISIEYRIGIAKNSEEHLAEITQLIALAYNRISDETIAH